MQRRSPQLKMQFMQSRLESLKKKRLAGIQTLTYAILVQCLTKELATQLGAGH